MCQFFEHCNIYVDTIRRFLPLFWRSRLFKPNLIKSLEASTNTGSCHLQPVNFFESINEFRLRSNTFDSNDPESRSFHKFEESYRPLSTSRPSRTLLNNSELTSGRLPRFVSINKKPEEKCSNEKKNKRIPRCGRVQMTLCVSSRIERAK